MSAKNNTHHFPKLLILVGAPGSGKSTFARYFIRTEDNWVRVNRDDFRLMQFGDSLMSPFYEERITKMVEASVIALLKNCTNVIIDATNSSLRSLEDMGYFSGLVPPKPYVAVKAPVFSFAKMQDVDISLGPEMKSTGEVMGIDYHYARALYKAITGAGMNMPKNGRILFTVADKDKEELKQLAKAFCELGFQIAATEGTARAIQSVGIDSDVVGKVHERSTDIIQMIKTGQIQMVVNTLTQGKGSARDGFKIRRATVEHGIVCLTSLDTAWEVLRVLSFMQQRRLVYALALQDYVGGGDDLA